MNNEVSEQELRDKAVAPRVTEDAVEGNIASEHYFTAYDGAVQVAQGENIPESLKLLTLCVLTLRNGFTVTGQSACAALENYNKDIGERLARKDAVNKIWAFMGYELRTKLMQGE